MDKKGCLCLGDNIAISQNSWPHDQFFRWNHVFKYWGSEHIVMVFVYNQTFPSLWQTPEENDVERGTVHFRSRFKRLLHILFSFCSFLARGRTPQNNRYMVNAHGGHKAETREGQGSMSSKEMSSVTTAFNQAPPPYERVLWVCRAFLTLDGLHSEIRAPETQWLPWPPWASSFWVYCPIPKITRKYGQGASRENEIY